MTALFWLAAFYLACLAVLAWLMATAPEGWEDARGFHLGRDPAGELAADATTAPASRPHTLSHHDAGITA